MLQDFKLDVRRWVLRQRRLDIVTRSTIDVGGYMHRRLKTLLPKALGVSDLVVAIFVDVRGFSSFARMAESSEAALFLRTMYLRILDEHFPDAAFFKPTGDGLMIIRHFDSDTLSEVVESSIRNSITLVDEFASITNGDPMINFAVPTNLGIGITRGAATRLASASSTLDYSGRPLNLSARLMDLARPYGVVFDASLTKDLPIDEKLLDQFVYEDTIYVKGIADVAPIEVYRTVDVQIPSRNRSPLSGQPHRDELSPVTARELKQLHQFIHVCQVEPIEPDQVRLEVRLPDVTTSGRRHPTRYSQELLEPVSVTREVDGWNVAFDYDEVSEKAAARGIKPTWMLERYLTYAIPEDGTL